VLEACVDGDHVQLYRWDRAEGTFKYLEPFDPSALRPLGVSEFARQRWGGGKFKARIRHRDGTYGIGRTFPIDGPVKFPEAPAASAAAPAAASSSTAWVDKIVMPLAGAFGTAFAGLIVKKFLETPAPDPLLLELVKALKGHAGAATDPLLLQKTIADAEARGETRGRELGELRAQVDATGKEHDGGVVGAIDRGLPQVLGVLTKKLEQDERRMSRLAPPSTLPGSPPAAASVTAPAAPSSDPLEAMLLAVPLSARKHLVNAAEGDEQPEIWAALVLTKLDDVTRARMPEFLARPDFADVWIRVCPAFEPFREWVEELVECMRLSLEASKEAEAADPVKNAAP
jgi:hypothetical protein